jgi:hypothetical protein
MEKNININTDDPNTNDYLYCWALFNNYDPIKFIKLIDSIKSESNTIMDIIPTDEDYIVNERSLVKLGDDILISYNHNDKLLDTGLIHNVVIYYIKSDKLIDNILIELEDMVLKLNNINKYNSMTITHDGLSVDSYDLLKYDFDNINLYYNKGVVKKSEKILKIIDKSDKGLLIIHGERGTGKTILVNHIVSSSNKPVIFIPSTMVDHTINNPDFTTFIKMYKNSIIIIDDCELYNKIFITNILQLVDGMLSDTLNLNIICLFNGTEDNIDENLLDCNNLHDVIEIGYLDNTECEKLCECLGIKNKNLTESRVVDVVRKKWDKQRYSEMGYN